MVPKYQSWDESHAHQLTQRHFGDTKFGRLKFFRTARYKVNILYDNNIETRITRIFRSSRQLFGKPLPQIFLLLQHPKGKGGSIYVFDVRLYRAF